MKLLLFVCIFVFSYLLLEIIIRKNTNEKIAKFIKLKNDKYYKDMVKYTENKKKARLKEKLSINDKINLLIEKSGIKRSILINPIVIIILCIACFLICYNIVFDVFKILFLSIIIALPTLLIPIVILNMIAENNSNKIEKIMLDFLLQLKSYTKISNDIIYAFKQIKVISPLQNYIDKFLIEINSGIKFEKAIEELKSKIDIKVLQEVFSNMQYCYLYGGDFSTLLDKSYDYINKIQKEKKKRNEETKSARLVLGILILLDLFIYFSFIKDNADNYRIMTTSIFGTIILYWNFISIWILFVLMNKVKKLNY